MYIQCYFLLSAIGTREHRPVFAVAGIPGPPFQGLPLPAQQCRFPAQSHLTNK